MWGEPQNEVSSKELNDRLGLVDIIRLKGLKLFGHVWNEDILHLSVI